MKIIDPSNQLQNDALLNEYKGNLFEFLVGNHLSMLYKMESSFLMNLNSDYKSRLSMYEEFIRINYPHLILKIQQMAQIAALKLNEYLKANSFQFFAIHLIGKSVATNNNQLWGETDLALEIMENNQKKWLKFSLKMSKINSFTNTKSAGSKSFIQKYFSSFKESAKDQSFFNEEIDFQFNKMGSKLYQSEGLNFLGQFDESWTESFSSLPGELNAIHRIIVFENYEYCIKKLYEILIKYYNLNRELFAQSLGPLLGFGDDEIIQFAIYHDNHDYKFSKIFNFNEVFKTEPEIAIIPLKPHSHNFEIKIDKLILQIRIKPMNKFTTASYKINCSIKGNYDE